MKKYVWIRPDLSFSGTWDEETQKYAWPDGVPEAHINNSGWRLMEFEIVAGEDFDFPHNSILTSKQKP